MKYLRLRNKGKAIVDDKDFAFFNKWKWYLSSDGYIKRNQYIGNKKFITIRMHTLLLKTKNGYEIDHINGNRFDNRRINLRLANRSENQCNRKTNKNSTSGFKGVSWHKVVKKWYAKIVKDKKYYFIGYFNTAHQAALSYDLWAKYLHKQYARLNYQPLTNGGNL